MIKRFLNHVLCLFALILTQRCAQVVPLSGGDKDLKPPKLIESVPLDKATNFQGAEIILKFDEFVQLKDLANQIVVSPQIKKIPEMEAQGKMVKIKLNRKDFNANTTYRIDFGRAIADMNEGNVLENFSFVFSTGAFIDTLKISGKVSYAFNNKDFQNALVCLYSDTLLKDSMVFKTIPNFISKSNSGAQFNFYNLPNAKYWIYAFDDKNKNMLYDGETEQIALRENPIVLDKDTIVNLKMFKEEPTKNFVKKTLMNNYGLAQIVYNKPGLFKVKATNSRQTASILETRAGLLKDTIVVFYKHIEDTLSLIIQNLNTSKSDTLKLSVPRKPNGKKALLNISLNENNGKMAFKQNPRLSFPNWMDTVHYNLKGISIVSVGDSIVHKPSIKGYWSAINNYELLANLKEATSYQLKIERGSFYNLDSLKNDSLVFKFKTQAKADFGNFNLKLKVSKKQNYIIQLLNEKEEIVREVIVESPAFVDSLTHIPFREILPGNYLVKIIYDDNQNKKWDRGNLTSLKLPETVVISIKRIKIVSDWETEEEILLDEKK